MNTTEFRRGPIVHGTVYRYREGCRCEECRAATRKTKPVEAPKAKKCLWCDRTFLVDLTSRGTPVQHLARGLCRSCYPRIRETYLKHGESF